MLSRVAERVYWMARYLDRAENTARIVNAYCHLLLDLPRSLHPGWETLIAISGSKDLFAKHYQKVDERNTIKFLLADRTNPGSILSSLSAARENGRTTRDIVPSSAFEQVNEMYLYGRAQVDQSIARRGRYEFLSAIIARCQQIRGLLAGTMSHDQAYDFMCLGRHLESADMTTRILDVGAALLLGRAETSAFDNLLWVNVLRSLGADQMYRQHERRRVGGEHVVRYLLKDTMFPRAVARCLNEAERSLTNLPRNENPLRSIVRPKRHVMDADVGVLIQGGLHDFLDELQGEMGTAHDSIADTWFSLEREAQVAAREAA